MKYTYLALGSITALAWYLAFTDDGFAPPVIMIFAAGKLTLAFFVVLFLHSTTRAFGPPLIEGVKTASVEYQSLSDEERQELKQASKRFFSKAEKNYQAYKSGEKGKISAIADIFLED